MKREGRKRVTAYITLLTLLFTLFITGVQVYAGDTPDYALSAGLQFDKTTYNRGENVQITLAVTGVDTGERTNSIEFKIQYDSSAFELSGDTAVNSINDGYLSSIAASKDNAVKSSTLSEVSALYAGQSDVAFREGEAILTLNMKVKNDAEYSSDYSFVLQKITPLDLTFNPYIVNSDNAVTFKVGVSENPAQVAADQQEVDNFIATLGTSPSFTAYADMNTIAVPAPPTEITAIWQNPSTEISQYITVNGSSAAVNSRPEWNIAAAQGTMDLVVTKGSASSTVTYNVTIMPELNTLQKLIIEAMKLNKGTTSIVDSREVPNPASGEISRAAFIKNVLEPMRNVTSLDETTIQNLVTEVKKYTTTLVDSKIRAAIINYAEKQDSALKQLVEDEVLSGLPSITVAPSGFAKIESSINSQIVGKPDNQDGLKFILKFMRGVVEMPLPLENGNPVDVGPIAYDDSTDAGKIDFKFRDDMSTTILEKIERNLSALIFYAPSVKVMIDMDTSANVVNATTDLQKFFAYAENIINGQATEVAAFKTWLASNSNTDYPIYMASTPAIKNGDVDNNGSINMTDALQVAYYATLQSTKMSVSAVDTISKYSYIADVDGNGTINMTDALQIAYYATMQYSKMSSEAKIRMDVQ